MNKFNRLYIALSILAFIGCGVGQAQDSFTNINLSGLSDNGVLQLSGTNIPSFGTFSEDELTALIDVLNATPTITATNLPRGGMGIACWSLQDPNMPPLPGDTIGVNAWPMEDGSLLLDDVNFNYNAGSLTASAMDSLPLPGGGSGDGGTNYAPAGSFFVFDPGTNLWIADTAVVGGYLTGIGSNTVADILYELQSRTNLTQPDWQSEGFISGSELTNYTPLSVFQNGRSNLFIRLRSWVDSYGIGIPDWWQFEYFGTNDIDPDASVAGDGYSNLQKFDMGLNPTNYYNPNGPPGFFGYVDGTGTNVFIAWSPPPGPVVNYSIQRGISNSLTGFYTFSQVGTVSSNVNFIEDVGAINNSNAWNNLYQLEAVYPGNSLSATDAWQVSWFGQYGNLGMPYGPPAPTNFYASADTNALNVLLSWTPASGVATNYLIERGIFNTASNAYVYHQIAAVSPATSAFKVTGPFTNADNWSDNYAVVAIYPGNVAAALAISPINVGDTNNLAAPVSFYGYEDGTGTNLVLTWTPEVETPADYIIFAGNTNELGTYAYVELATVNGNATALVVTNGFNNLYGAYAIFGVETNGSLSQAAFWQSANGTPPPGNLIAYFDATGTNVWLSWTAPTGAINGYLVTRFDPSGDIFEYDVNANTTTFEDTNAVNTGSFDPNYTEYTVQALYSRGGVSATAWATVGNVPAPTGLAATLDTTGKNVTVTWAAVPGAINYVIDRGVMNPATGNYSYSQIATVGAGVTLYVDAGAITSANSYNNEYEVEAIFPGGVASPFGHAGVSESSSVPQANVYVSANLVRNGTGRWQVMFSGLPTNSPQVVQINFSWGLGYLGEAIGNIFSTNLCTTNIPGSIYQIPDSVALTLTATNDILTVSAQLFGPNGEPGQISLAGYLANDAPYFVDGRRHMKQNLSFLLSAASENRPFVNSMSDASLADGTEFYVGGTNFEEFSFLHEGESNGDYDPTTSNYSPDLDYFQLDNLWPFVANYDLANYILDTSRTNVPYGTTNFNFLPNVTTSIPAPAILGQPGSESILQPGLSAYLQNQQTGLSPMNWGLSINPQLTTASLSASANLFGMAYSGGYIVLVTNQTYSYQAIGINGRVTVPAGYLTSGYSSSCANPSLSLVNYYFAPLLPPISYYVDISGLSLPGENINGDGFSNQPYPLPIEPDFNVTNTTPPIIASVGQPMIIGGWAKYAVGSGKFAYLGQYFVTNVFLFDTNGVVTTNTAGVMSPYGEFFPLQTGTAQFTTMGDVDNPSQQGTGVVQIISLNVDANHDGVMDLSYAGPDQTSPSRPFRFWINDNQDSGDVGGDGVPGKGQWGDANMDASADDYRGFVEGFVHGRRDLVDFFPVYLNIRGLVQALPPGPNVKYILKQADSALRFCYTDLTPTNYMNFLRDTIESGKLATNLTMTISPDGYILDDNFVRNIVTNNQGILLMEGRQNTTNPLVLEIWQGTSLNNGESPYLFTPQKKLGQTALPLSLSDVEQMFRHKNILLDANDAVKPDRLTDASVPNEPDTVDKNFVFLHGYNVNPGQARGWGADLYKRMYWSGSHAKFYGVTWTASDSQVAGQVTINLQTNIVHAFNTAPLLNNFLNSLSGINVLAAHSLGNMVVLSTLNDCTNQTINTYCMIDAAVAIEAIDRSAPLNPDMYSSTWTNYESRLWASEWHNLFPTNDARNQLTWSGRLANLQDTSVYNFYSSGEEVLRDYPTDPPVTYIGIVASQLVSIWEGNTGENAWAFQEKLKGLMPRNGFLSSNHGGWQFNQAYETNTVVDSFNYWEPMSPAAAAELTVTELQTNAFFNWGSASGSSLPFNNDLSLESSSGSSYAQANQNRILSDAIPCLTLPVGANLVPRLQPPESPVQLNFDMQGTCENGWPASRPARTTGVSAAGEWHHSDVRAVAYTFTYPLFNQIVIVGNLK